MTSALNDRLIRYARSFIDRGSTLALNIREAPLDAIPDLTDKLCRIEGDLEQLYLALQPGDDLPATEAPLDLSKYAAEGEPVHMVASRWAALACEGHLIHDLIWPSEPYREAGRFSAALATAGVAEDRYRWAPGLTQNEAERFCAALDLPTPEPLADLDDLIVKAHQSQHK